MDRETETEQEEEGVPGEDGDSNHSYEDDLDFDDYDDRDGSRSHETRDDGGHSRHSDTSRVSDEGKTSTSPLPDRGSSEDEESRHGSQDSINGEEKAGIRGGEEKSDDDDDDKAEGIKVAISSEHL